jgi:hypothetical protein
VAPAVREVCRAAPVDPEDPVAFPADPVAFPADPVVAPADPACPRAVPAAPVRVDPVDVPAARVDPGLVDPAVLVGRAAPVDLAVPAAVAPADLAARVAPVVPVAPRDPTTAAPPLPRRARCGWRPPRGAARRA